MHHLQCKLPHERQWTTIWVNDDPHPAIARSKLRGQQHKVGQLQQGLDPATEYRIVSQKIIDAENMARGHHWSVPAVVAVGLSGCVYLMLLTLFPH